MSGDSQVIIDFTFKFYDTHPGSDIQDMICLAPGNELSEQTNNKGIDLEIFVKWPQGECIYQMSMKYNDD